MTDTRCDMDDVLNPIPDDADAQLATITYSPHSNPRVCEHDDIFPQHPALFDGMAIPAVLYWDCSWTSRTLTSHRENLVVPDQGTPGDESCIVIVETRTRPLIQADLLVSWEQLSHPLLVDSLRCIQEKVDVACLDPRGGLGNEELEAGDPSHCLLVSCDAYDMPFAMSGNDDVQTWLKRLPRVRPMGSTRLSAWQNGRSARGSCRMVCFQQMRTFGR